MEIGNGSGSIVKARPTKTTLNRKLQNVLRNNHSDALENGLLKHCKWICTQWCFIHGASLPLHPLCMFFGEDSQIEILTSKGLVLTLSFILSFYFFRHQKTTITINQQELSRGHYHPQLSVCTGDTPLPARTPPKGA